MKRICTIDGCGKPTNYTFYCGKHYMRMRRKGDPLAHTKALRTPGESLQVLHNALSSDSQECILWPHMKDRKGYGRLHYQGRVRAAHRLICILRYGDPPENFDAAHSCGNASCVNPNHLRWASRAENHRDKSQHGTHLEGEMVANAKLTRQAVEFILANPKMSHASLGLMFGVTLQAIALVRRRKNWKHVEAVSAA